jgi:hypothetical protein
MAKSISIRRKPSNDMPGASRFVSDTGIRWRGIELRPVIGLSDLQQQPSQGETGANGPGVFRSMAQDDNRICVEFLGPPGGKCYETSMPYRSGGSVEIADYIVQPRRINEIRWNHVRVVRERSR